MPRRPKPWRRAGAGGAWYAQVRGDKVRLSDPGASFEEADKALHRILADGGEPAPREGRPIGVRELLERFLDHVKAARKASTKEFYHDRLKTFGRAHGAMDARDVRPHHVLDWANRPGWGPSTRRSGISAVQAAWRWGKKVGHLAENTLSEIDKPPRGRRTAIPDGATVERAIGAANVPLGRFLEFLHETGCRPGEAARVEAKDVDFGRGVVTLAEHKTAGASRRPRTIVLSSRALAMLRTLAAEHPEGPLFRNTRGGAWTNRALAMAAKRLRLKIDAGSELTCHALRHRYATDMAKTSPNSIVAALLGHSSTRMVDEVYSHVHDEIDTLRDAVRKGRPGD